MIGRFLRNDPNRIQDAIELLQWNTETYPASSVAWETLGDTYLKIKNEKDALLMYQKAIALEPGKEALKQKLKQLTN